MALTHIDTALRNAEAITKLLNYEDAYHTKGPQIHLNLVHLCTYLELIFPAKAPESEPEFLIQNNTLQIGWLGTFSISVDDFTFVQRKVSLDIRSDSFSDQWNQFREVFLRELADVVGAIKQCKEAESSDLVSMSIAEILKLYDVSRSSIDRWAKDSRITYVIVQERGLYLIDQSHPKMLSKLKKPPRAEG